MGAHALPIRGDAKNRSDVIRAIDEMLNSFGKVDILINNVGIYPVESF